MKKISYILLLTVCSILLTGCKSNIPNIKNNTIKEETEKEPDSSNSETISLLVWGSEEDETLLNQIFTSFQEEYKEQANFQITFAAQGESGCKDALMADLENSADVFTFADDQLNTLAAAGAINPIENMEKIKSTNLEGAVEAASIGDTLYAYPLTADNGYFLYYNQKYLSKQDIETLDQILAVAAKQHKKFAMDWSSGWYVYSFFGNTGLEVGLNTDGITNYCTWNKTDSTIKGIDVANSMLEIAKNAGFSNMDDTHFLAGVQNGSVIAGISGIWNEVAVKQAWGNYYGAAKLPTYTCNGQQIQMSSFSGYKLIGVNAYSAHYEWASKLAEWISNEQNQQLRFELRGQGPSNIFAAKSTAVQESLAISALLAQSDYSRLQRIGNSYWDPVTEFAQNIAAKNPTNESLQIQLDKMVEQIIK